MDYKSRYALWCAENLPGEIKEELNRISDNEEELKSCFGETISKVLYQNGLFL